MATLSEPSNISLLSNDSLMVKRLFLNFIQSYFAQHTKYTWSLGVNSKILIIDKYAMDLTQTAKKPSIVLSRGGMRWANSSIGQLSKRSVVSSNATFTDLSVGTITLNCIAKNGIVCEELALTLRNLFTVYKLQLKKVGIHSIDNIAIDEERTLMADSDIVLTVVPVTIQYSKQSTLQYLQDFYSVNAVLTFSGVSYGGYSGYITPENTSVFQLYENQHYTTWASGIVFGAGFAPPVGSTLNLTYIDAASLQTIEEVAIGTINNSNRVFSTSYPIYGDYPILSSLTYTLYMDGDVIPESVAILPDYYRTTFDWDFYEPATQVLVGENGSLDFTMSGLYVTVPPFEAYYQYYGYSPSLDSAYGVIEGINPIKMSNQFTLAISFKSPTSNDGPIILTIGDRNLNNTLFLNCFMDNSSLKRDVISVGHRTETGSLLFTAWVSGLASYGGKFAISVDLDAQTINAAYLCNPGGLLFSSGFINSFTELVGTPSSGITNPYMTIGSEIWPTSAGNPFVVAEIRFYADQIFSSENLLEICSELKEIVAI